ncbi:MAG: hypothetical protein ABSE16_18385 [Verrucomicrobiota bacterium]
MKINRKERKERSAGCPNPQHSRTQSIVEFRRELLPSEISNLKSEIPASRNKAEGRMKNAEKRRRPGCSNFFILHSSFCLGRVLRLWL